MVGIAPARRLPTIVSSAAAAATGCVAIAATAAANGALPPLWPLAGCLLLLFVGTRFHLPIRLGAQRVELTWSEAALVLALGFTPSAWVVLLTPIAVLLHFAGRQPAIRTVYNVAHNTIAAAAAAAIVTAADVTRPIRGMDLIAILVAGAVSFLVTYLAVAIVISVVQEVGILATWRESGGLQVATLAGNLSIAYLVLVLIQYDRRAVLALPVLALFLHQSYVGRFRTHQERAAGRRKSMAIGQLTADLDEPGVVRRAAREAAMLTAADVVEVELPASQGSSASLYRYNRDGSCWSGPALAAPPLHAGLVARVPIASEGRDIGGELRVWLAGGTNGLRLSASDQDALHILAVTAAAALENARAHAEMTRLATTDRTSGLPIRSVLIDRIEGSLRQSERLDLPAVALILIDITGFRGVVRDLGHDTAEELLARTGKQLRNAARPDEFVAVVGGDDFAVYLGNAGDPAYIRDRALAFLDAVAEPLLLPVGRVTLDAVAGIAYSPTPIASGTEFLRQAMFALDQARRRELRVEFYEPGADVLGGPTAVVMDSELHEALERNELELHYQPIVHVPSRVPIAVEALVRWRHPTKGYLLAREFMPVLEKSRDHGKFVAWQLDQAIGVRRLWQDRDLPISVNLAARCLLDTTFPERIEKVLSLAGMQPDQLMLEFAESPTLTGSATALRVVSKLRELGVRIAIDGLGTGSGSLIGLMGIPASDLKIGAAFVSSMLEDDRAAGVVRMAIELGQQSDLRVIALGVRSDEHVGALIASGCNAAQGFHLARPMGTVELSNYLRNAPRATAPYEADVIRLDHWRRAVRLD